MNTRFLALAAAALGLAQPAGGQGTLGGVWRLDSTRSADLEKAFELHARNDGLRARGSLQGQTGARQVPGVGSTVPDVSSSRPISAEEAADLARPLVDEADMFELVETDSTVVFHPLDLTLENVSLVTDGKKHDAYFGMSTEKGQLKAERKGEGLRIERKTEELQVKEDWSLAEDGAALVQDVEIKGRILQKTLKYRRVYLRGL
jgi:hypothetical protein